MAGTTAHIPDDGSSLSRRIAALESAFRRQSSAQRVTAVASLTAWTDMTLFNGWSYAGSPWGYPQYRRQTDGAVQLVGSVAPGTTTAGTVIAALPVDYGPEASLEFRVSGGSITAYADLVVSSDGLVTITGSAGTLTRLSLTDIRLPK